MDPRKVEKRLQTYENDELVVTFDPNLCRHTGVCVRGLNAVFNIKERRWIRLENATAAEISAQVARCPSGALQYQLKNESEP